MKAERREVPVSRDEEWARFWASLDDWPDAEVPSKAQREAEEWEAALDALYDAAFEQAEREAEVFGDARVSALDEWERWPRSGRFGSRSVLLLVSDL